jgi:hypothetical protein
MKKTKQYTDISGENVTEIQIMGLRSAAAELKKHLEDVTKS